MRSRMTRFEQDALLEEQDKIHSFEYIWEQDARWLMGIQILGDIVKFLEGKSLKAEFRDEARAVNVTVPLPTVKDEISQQQVSIFYFVPEELRSLFEGKITNVMTVRYCSFLTRIFAKYEGQRMTHQILSQINFDLQQLEQEQLSLRQPSLAQNVAHEFGLLPNREAPLYFMRKG